MNNSKNKRTAYLAAILIGLLIVAYKVLFMNSSTDFQNEESAAASLRAETILQQVDSINFDTTILNNPIFNSLISIEKPLINLPVGRKNPFSNLVN